jgi:hypothetical protein
MHSALSHRSRSGWVVSAKLMIAFGRTATSGRRRPGSARTRRSGAAHPVAAAGGTGLYVFVPSIPEGVRRAALFPQSDLPQPPPGHPFRLVRGEGYTIGMFPRHAG